MTAGLDFSRRWGGLGVGQGHVALINGSFRAILRMG